MSVLGFLLIVLVVWFMAATVTTIGHRLGWSKTGEWALIIGLCILIGLVL